VTFDLLKKWIIKQIGDPRIMVRSTFSMFYCEDSVLLLISPNFVTNRKKVATSERFEDKDILEEHLTLLKNDMTCMLHLPDIDVLPEFTVEYLRQLYVDLLFDESKKYDLFEFFSHNGVLSGLKYTPGSKEGELIASTARTLFEFTRSQFLMDCAIKGIHA